MSLRVITGNAARDSRPTDVWDRLLVEAYNGSSKEPRNSGTKLSGKRRSLKAAMYMGEWKKPHTVPVNMHIHENPENT